MKKIPLILLFLVAIILLIATIYMNKNNPPSEETPIADALKISARVLDKDLEGTGYWAYTTDFRKYPNDGYWVSYDDKDKQFDDDEVFYYEPLEVGVKRTMAPLGFAHSSNLTIMIEFDGVVEIEAGKECKDNVEMSYYAVDSEGKRTGDVFPVGDTVIRAPMKLNVCPIGKFTSYTENVVSSTLVYKEYIIYIRAYDDTDRLMVTAELELKAIQDPHYNNSKKAFYDNVIYSPNDELTRFLTIELISYEYSDMYKLMEE